ncbi:hypothetical protein CANINC_002203 [Pichia inconspicua]|uniref:Uncharacterized protein n=1 Tax=Pichia inconspicua TaxID=52247 RepID=A0A4T0X236_9ASCO|nr:hypothetical protein CANINC_002203 [[Candida] inconspicua]
MSVFSIYSKSGLSVGMNTSSILIASKNAIKGQVKKKLKYFLDTFHGDRSVPALKELEKINDRSEVDMGLTTLANNIFIKSENEISSERYRDFLKRFELDTCYYDVSRYLHNEQYEQASILAIQKFDILSRQDFIDKEKLVFQLKLHSLLIMASDRNDTFLVIDLIDKLSQYNLITNQNYSFLISSAIKYKNEEILCKLIEFMKTGDFNDTTLVQIFDCLIDKRKSTEALSLISHIRSNNLKTLTCLKYVATFDSLEMFVILNNLYNDGCLEVTYDDLPPEYLSISGLRDFEMLGELCSKLLPTMETKMKEILLFSILSSINNKDVPIDSSLYILNYCKDHEVKLNHKHKDIIFQQLSKYPLKITSLRLYQYFKINGFEITPSNYQNLLACHMNGTEIDTALYVLVEYLYKYHKLSDSMLIYLKDLITIVPDPRLNAFLSYTSLQDLKDLINYDYIAENAENERDRSKVDFNPIARFKPYSYSDDIRNAQFFKG